ncbi:MAG: hypothetical protein JW864_08345 [Spirochaetes bacterium]|nr:hypothetical protein [Spirochaetota bacterium]
MIFKNDSISNILHSNPLFRHLEYDEIQKLKNISDIKRVSKKEIINTKKIKSFGIILDGLFELGQKLSGENIYLFPGSFFGDIPFTDSRYVGLIKAVVNSQIMLFNPDELYKVFLSSYKGLRGYIRNIKRNGFEVVNYGRDFLKTNSKIITVFSNSHRAGNSIVSSLLGIFLSESGKTIILDASYGSLSPDGGSVFNVFDKKLVPAVSQKAGEETDGNINNRIVQVTDSLSLLNISSGSKIKINTEILSPVISILSRNYKYIILDHSGYDKDFSACVLTLSDVVFSVVKDLKDKKSCYDIFDSNLKDGQRVYYILNRHFSKNIGKFEGGYIFDDLDLKKRRFTFADYKEIIENTNTKAVFDNLSGLINAEKTGLVIETGLLNAGLLSGFFSTLYDKDVKIDLMYSSCWSYLITALFILSGSSKEFEKRFLQIFSDDKINSLMDITFPEEYIYKNKIYSFIKNIAGEGRLEHYSVIPMARISEHDSSPDISRGKSRIFSTGFISEIFSASFIFDLFEPQKITDRYYHNGFPDNYVTESQLIRTDIDKILSVSVKNSKDLAFSLRKILTFHGKFINGLQSGYYDAGLCNTENNTVIEADMDIFNAKEMLKVSKQICENIEL